MNEATYKVILDTAKKALTRSRLPRWLKDSLVDDILAQALIAQAIKPARGKELAHRVARIARTIVHGQWYEARWNADGRRKSKSVLRIANPVLGEDGEWLSPLDTIGVDAWGKLASFVPVYRGGSVCGFRSTRKYANIVEDRMIAWLDKQRLYRALIQFLQEGDNARFVIRYVSNRRLGRPASVAERVRFHRLKKRCNVRLSRTAIG